MSSIVIKVEQLREMLGTCVMHEGVEWRVIEVLEDGPSIVLLNHCHNVVQSDQYGDGYRRVVEHRTIQILTEDGAAIHPDFLALDLIDRE